MRNKILAFLSTTLLLSMFVQAEGINDLIQEGHVNGIRVMSVKQRSNFEKGINEVYDVEIEVTVGLPTDEFEVIGKQFVYDDEAYTKRMRVFLVLPASRMGGSQMVIFREYKTSVVMDAIKYPILEVSGKKYLFNAELGLLTPKN